VIKDYQCNESDKLVASADIDLCAQLLVSLDRFHRFISSYYTASVVLSHGSGQYSPAQGVESSFCLSVRQHVWIPVVGNQLLKPAEVYFLPQSNNNNVPSSSFFCRYVPHLDSAKVPLNDNDFIDNILVLKKQVLPMTMFELFMKWSCSLDSDTLWRLVNANNDNPYIIPCTLLPLYAREPHLDTIDNLRHIYHFLLSDVECRTLLERFRLWPLIFVPCDKSNGSFLFAHQVFWDDPTSLLSQRTTQQRIPIQSFYGDDNNAQLQSFFTEILHVELRPTLDDYLPLLLMIDHYQENVTWRLTEVVARLTLEQNRQIEVREKCADIAFIPCLGNEKKNVKYSDQPFYPHYDTIINDLFSDKLRIIKLSDDVKLLSQFEHCFCSLFQIQRLVDIIQVLVSVDNEQQSVELLDFYAHSIDLIQYFLCSNSLISDTRSQQLGHV
ncbi:unnamed protein product, partial [Didymodactylos carnosus]